MRHGCHASCVLALLTACYHPIERPNCGVHDECPSGLVCGPGHRCAEPAEIPDARSCYGTTVPVCFSIVPARDRILTADVDIDTDSTDDAICDQHNDSSRYCVYAGARISVATRVTAHGSRPLVLLSTTTFDHSGDIDVSSNHQGAQLVGAGAASHAQCPGQAEATGSSGSYGGGFGGRGGDGNDGNPDDGARGLAGPASTAFPTTLRGGCPGGDAVTGPGSLTGRGGAGGGAVAIVAGTSISLNGRINASGAGGNAGTIAAKSGGGGGGSGGMIVLDSPTIVVGVRTVLIANGGGGAQGGAASGAPGYDGGESSSPQLRAAGGLNPGAIGGYGADGSLGSGLAGASAGGSAQNGGGGGGGGGGAGFIRAPGVVAASLISPPSS